MSLKKYKSMDIFVFSIIAVVFELLNYFASTSLANFKLIFMSFSIVLALVSMFRWGIEGVIVSLAGGIAACCAARSSDYVQYLAYGIGSLAVLIPYYFFQVLVGRETLSSNKFILIFYLIIDFLFVILVRCLIVSLFDFSNFSSTFNQAILNEVVMESMSLVISLLILLIASRKNGNMLVEMNKYVRDVKDRMKLGGLKEYKESSSFNHDKPFTEEGEIDESYLLDGGQLSNDQLTELEDLFKKDVEGKTENNNSKEKVNDSSQTGGEDGSAKNI